MTSNPSTEGGRPDGGRRARRESERSGAGDAGLTPASDAEVLDSRRSRRSARIPHPDRTLHSGHTPHSAAIAPRTVPQTRRQSVERSRRRGAAVPPPTTGLVLGDLDGGFFKPTPGPADGTSMETPSTGSVPVTHASRRSLRAAATSTGSIPASTGSIPASTGSTRTTTGSIPTTAIGPSTTELAIIRGRRAATPQTPRRRFELAVGRSLSNRRVWGGVIAVVMVLAVPGASMLAQNVSVTDRELASGGDALGALKQFPDSTRLEQPDATETAAEATARAKARAKATAEATAKETAEATKKAQARNKNKTKKGSAAPTVPAAGYMGRLTNARSGLPWVSGVYARGMGTAGLTAFGEWRGAAVDVVVDWQARNSWDDITNPDWIFRTWKDTPYTKVIGVAPIPEGDGSATLAGCAAGSYNDKWRAFGQAYKNAGMDDDTVIRLGWEFNGNWYKWSAYDPNQFAECWRQIVGTVKTVAPNLLWDWNVNRGKGASVADAREAYPGDAYVDIVGVDSYDMWPGVTDEATWARQYTGPYGLKFWSDFAKQHGKKVSVPEWGVYPGPSSSGSNGGDNAFYITKMQSFFKSEGSHLAYESYFNESASYVAAALFSPTLNPNAAAKYRALFSS